MENQIIEHRTINGKFKIQFEQSAVKGVLGFKVETSGDNMAETMEDAKKLLDYACLQTKPEAQIEGVKNGI